MNLIYILKNKFYLRDSIHPNFIFVPESFFMLPGFLQNSGSEDYQARSERSDEKDMCKENGKI